MSLWNSITGFIFTGDATDQEARGAALDKQLSEKNLRDYSPGGDTYERIAASSGPAAANAAQKAVVEDLAKGSTAAVTKQGDQNYDATHGPSDSGLGKLASDVLLLGIAGAAVWAFAKFGGFAWLKGKARTVTWLPWALGAGVILAAWWTYNQFKTTAKDAGDVGNNLTFSTEELFGEN